MSLLRKKLFLKFLMIELNLLWIGGATAWIFPMYGWAIVIAITLINITIFFKLVSHPLNLILREFKALLTGKRYNRIYTQKVDEIGVAAHFFNEITRSLERVSTDIKDHRRISSELNVARKIQRDLIPQTMPDIPGLCVVAKTKPAAEIGGDSFDFITVGNQTFLYIGDVTGHGVPSGLVMMIVDTLIHTFVDLVQNSYELLFNVNKYLKPRIQSTMFMTMIMLRWEHNTKQLYFSGAGHETLIHYDRTEQKCNNIKSGGIALGMVPDNQKLIKEKILTWKQGDFLVLYTDGIVEARNTEGEMYGIKRLLKVIEKEAPTCSSAEMLFQRISTHVIEFLGEHIQEDDMTMIVIQHTDQKDLFTQQDTSTQWKESKSMVDYEKENVEESGLSTS